MYDVAILGGGPGGYVAAEQAASLGLSVALIEKDALGGTCLNRGCIPTKSLLNAAKLYKHACHSAAMGVKSVSVEFDLVAAMSWKSNTVSRLVGGVEFLMKQRNVTVIKGSGELSGPGRLLVKESGQVIEARHIIIATGSVPARPPIPGAEGNPAVLTSDELLNISQLPKSLVVIGGGVIGIEFASFFAALGIPVTVIEMLPEILPFIDAEVVGVLKRTLKGITVLAGTAVARIDGTTVRYSKDGAEGSASGELILLATGRRPMLDGIGLEASGIQFSKKGIQVDDQCRTTQPNIWAIGDVNGRSLLAHSASAMGRAVAALIAGQSATIPWQAFPWVVYGDPEAAGVGLTEAEAQSAGIEYRKAALPARTNGRFLAENGVTGHGLVNILAAKADGRVLGVHLVCPYAGEMIWGMQYAIANGATIHDLEQVVFPHPTVSELLHDAAGSL
ncbi:MAG: dihydrolipoyl dehydrogenase [Spirochaetes bacterium GWD1_61_31]|nr:MAG: dihydrolipoyl dehydrogenase [Spirochaetes bacterium GWB1_60_80]OHD34635.1 MAG: dihydrolipoyl dehydrogenase [Spirochaetes bacterium GWD1_61_31]OHD46451.1 MAG: dihydrolipoyl dehydrogenase [Spirochaetes bacterium GWE1_60_18]OHD59506.1 MAG: dihydrolipoyl dehydrogenase [Spirochaetes bacterium GWF1_60_12]HBO42127.1 dihydrolipoyl dehydrogenase [Spirochaetaceae bacterium]